MYVRGVIEVLPNQGQHVVLYTGGGFTPGAKVITVHILLCIIAL